MIATLHSDRLVLRPLTMHDAPAIQRHFGTWHVIQHLSAQVPWPYPDDGAESFLRDVLLPAVRAGRVMAWGIALRNAPHEVIGMIEYRQGDTVTDNRGFWLSAEHQGRGYMTEAIVAFQDHIFFDLDVERIYVHNAVSNTASRRVK